MNNSKHINTLVKNRERSKAWYYTFGKLPEVIAKRKQILLNWRRENPNKYLYQLAKQRSKECKREFNLDLEDIVIPEMCPILKKHFEYGTPLAMSIDRIDPSKGYVKGNVQVISRKANLMKQDATLEELKNFVNWVNQSQPS